MDNASILLTPLAMILNRSIVSGQVPQEWREANVSQIYKNKGTKSKAKNYYQISLTSVQSKSHSDMLILKDI